jgi:hypothetical protein
MSDTVQQWEIVSEETYLCPRQVTRLAVPGGWLYAVSAKSGPHITLTTTFVPWPAADVERAMNERNNRIAMESMKAQRDAHLNDHAMRPTQRQGQIGQNTLAQQMAQCERDVSKLNAHAMGTLGGGFGKS